MNLFWLLTLAHLIGDFPLQTDAVYYYKTTYKWGVFLHVSIVGIMNVLFTLPYLRFPAFWVVLLLLFVSHIFYDSGKIWVTKNVLRDNVYLFLFDQFLHFFTIWLLTVGFLAIYPKAPYSFAWPFFSNTTLIIQLSGFVLATFALAPLIFSIRVYVNKRKPKQEREDLVFPSFSERLPGYVERFFLTLFSFLGGWFWLGAFLLLGLRVWAQGGWDWPVLIFGDFVALLVGILLHAYTL